MKEKASKSGKTVDTKKSKGKSSKSSAKHSPMSEPKMKRDESNPTLRPADEERASTLAAPTTLPVHKNLALPANKPKLGAISSPAGLGYTGDKGSVPLADILLNAFEKVRCEENGNVFMARKSKLLRTKALFQPSNRSFRISLC